MDELARLSAKLTGVSAMSNRYLVLVLTEPTEGNEARFNEYYEHTHLDCLLYTSPSPRDVEESRMPSSA